VKKTCPDCHDGRVIDQSDPMVADVYDRNLDVYPSGQIATKATARQFPKAVDFCDTCKGTGKVDR
jgi:hypothetical protein